MGLGTAERHSLERGVRGALVTELALEEHDLRHAERKAADQRDVLQRRHRAVPHPTDCQVGSERARLRLEAGAHHRSFDALRQSRERRLRCDPDRDDARAPGGRKHLDRTESQREGGAGRSGRRHLGAEPRKRGLLDLPEEMQRQVVARSAHPAHRATPGRRLERLGDLPDRTTLSLGKRDAQECTQAQERFLSR
jgi:hypothetical protein